ncbi:hypothetical protein E3C22_01155 [Jiella endophytica]|uniref:DUF5615 domain-containing protein n=1 Tax=Jiella endophytica TaxID=2558362 RepID=A0A4Y8RS15_9HYPH|nr:DUF5615 family PIN-like protein [Jiella endophytica]TFF27120.1 hypothetical protein E3C22_01155 [Jiella endophytica]
MRKILLDENMPRRLSRLINEAGGDATPFPNDWKRPPDAEMLDFAEKQGFDLILTADKNMPFQQTLGHRKLCVVVMLTSDRKSADRQASQIVGCLEAFVDGRFMVLDSEGHLNFHPA